MPGMKATMHEWKEGKLHSGSKHGPIVKKQSQAIAIAMHEKGLNEKVKNFHTSHMDGGFKKKGG